MLQVAELASGRGYNGVVQEGNNRNGRRGGEGRGLYLPGFIKAGGENIRVHTGEHYRDRQRADRR